MSNNIRVKRESDDEDDYEVDDSLLIPPSELDLRVKETQKAMELAMTGQEFLDARAKRQMAENIHTSWLVWFLIAIVVTILTTVICIICSYGEYAMTGILCIGEYVRTGCNYAASSILQIQRDAHRTGICVFEFEPFELNLFGTVDPVGYFASALCRKGLSAMSYLPDFPGLAVEVLKFLAVASDAVVKVIYGFAAVLFAVPIFYYLRQPPLVPWFASKFCLSYRTYISWSAFLCWWTIKFGIIAFVIISPLRVPMTNEPLLSSPQPVTPVSVKSTTVVASELTVVRNISTGVVVRMNQPVNGMNFSSVEIHSTPTPKNTSFTQKVAAVAKQRDATRRQQQLWDNAWHCSGILVIQACIHYSEDSDVYDYAAFGAYGTHCAIQWARWYYDSPDYLSSVFDYAGHIPAVHSVLRAKKSVTRFLKAPKRVGGPVVTLLWKALKCVGGFVRNLPQKVIGIWGWATSIWALLKESYSQSSTRPLLDAIQQSTLSWPVKLVLSFIVA